MRCRPPRQGVLATKGGLVDGETGSTPGRDGAPGARARGDRRARSGACAPTGSTCTSCTASTRDVPLEERWGAMAGPSRRQGARARPLGGDRRRSSSAHHAIHPVPACRPSCRCGRATRSPRCCPGAASTAPASSPSRRSAAASSPARSRASEFGGGRLPSEQPALHAGGHGHEPAIVDSRRRDRRRARGTPARWRSPGRSPGRAVVPIPGTKRMRRLEENTEAADLALRPRTSSSSTRCPHPPVPGTDRASSYGTARTDASTLGRLTRRRSPWARW